MHCAVQKVCRRLTCKHCARRGEQGEVMTLTILSVAYPLASVGPDAVGGAEQILTYAIHEAIREEATSSTFSADVKTTNTAGVQSINSSIASN